LDEAKVEKADPSSWGEPRMRGELVNITSEKMATKLAERSIMMRVPDHTRMDKQRLV
jgi:hypothetical protein